MESLMPVNFSVEDAHAAADLDATVESPEVPKVEELDNWAQEAYSLDVSAATTRQRPWASR